MCQIKYFQYYQTPSAANVISSFNCSTVCGVKLKKHYNVCSARKLLFHILLWIIFSRVMDIVSNNEYVDNLLIMMVLPSGL